MPGLGRFANRNTNASASDHDNTTVKNRPNVLNESGWSDAGFEQQDNYQSDEYSYGGQSDVESFMSDNYNDAQNYMDDDLSHGTKDSYGEEGAMYEGEFGYEEEFPLTTKEQPIRAIGTIDESNSASQYDNGCNSDMTDDGNVNKGNPKDTASSIAVTPNYGRSKAMANKQDANSNQLQTPSVASVSFPGRVIPRPLSNNAGKASAPLRLSNLARRTSVALPPSNFERKSPPLPSSSQRRVSFGALTPQAVPDHSVDDGERNLSGFHSNRSRTNLSRTSILRGKKTPPVFQQDPYVNVTDNRSIRKEASAVTPHSVFEKRTDEKENVTMENNDYDDFQTVIATKTSTPENSTNKQTVSEEQDFDDFETIAKPTSISANKIAVHEHDDLESNHGQFQTINRETEDLQEQIRNELRDMNHEFTESFSQLMRDLERSVNLEDKLEAMVELTEKALAEQLIHESDE